MARELLALINERIERKREKLIGTAVSLPYLYAFGSYSAWVVDVLYRSDEELLIAVPIAESGRNVRDFVNLWAPVELQRSNSGQFFIVGLADRQRGAIYKNTYSITDAGLGFTEGWKKNDVGSWINGNNNPVSPGTPEEIVYYYETEIIPFGELNFGVTPWGASRTTRYPS